MRNDPGPPAPVRRRTPTGSRGASSVWSVILVGSSAAFVGVAGVTIFVANRGGYIDRSPIARTVLGRTLSDAAIDAHAAGEAPLATASVPSIATATPAAAPSASVSSTPTAEPADVPAEVAAADAGVEEEEEEHAVEPAPPPSGTYTPVKAPAPPKKKPTPGKKKKAR